ncbi:hypothetical protein PG988_015453 [Apiospora saccharicola]
MSWFAFEAEKERMRAMGPRIQGRTGSTMGEGTYRYLTVAADLQDLNLYEAEKGNATVRQTVAAAGRLSTEGRPESLYRLFI